MAHEHEKLDWELDEEAYWDFSYPELGFYDLTAMLRTVHESTGFKQIKYVGHSLGSTQMFFAL